MKNSRSWWSGEEAPWEKKIAVIISLIQNIEVYLQKFQKICILSLTVI